MERIDKASEQTIFSILTMVPIAITEKIVPTSQVFTPKKYSFYQLTTSTEPVLTTLLTTSTK
jgi:hypothetical protein